MLKEKSYLWRLKQRNKLICYWLLRLFRSPATFQFKGQDYRYFWHRYNATWRNERAVEIPIVRAFLEESAGKSILEVGNVLSHYEPVGHDIVDKYEVADGVVNQDICTFTSEKRYDLIVSISTLEHVGWDEEPKDERKCLEAFANLRRLLAPGGRIVVTLPLGYNPALDRWIREGKIGFSGSFFLKRSRRQNEWREVSFREVESPQYDKSAFVAHELLIGIIADI